MDELSAPHLGQAIRRLRLSQNRSVEAVARAMGISRTTYSNIEAGRGSVAMDIVLAAIKLLGVCDPTEILISAIDGAIIALPVARKRASQPRKLPPNVVIVSAKELARIKRESQDAYREAVLSGMQEPASFPEGFVPIMTDGDRELSI